MTDIFLKIVNMSISASWVVLAVLLLRLLLKKAPKWINCVLWGIVGIRLIFPFSIQSMLSLIPSKETISPEIMTDTVPEINTGIPIINDTINPVINQTFSPEPTASANPLQIWIPIIATAWTIGIVVMLAYTMISYFRLQKKIGTAVLLRDNIYQSENVVTPFVLGIINPKIYLPFNINGQDMEHVIAHEQAHIKRKDHLWKPIGFLLLTIHWFNPLMWLGYVLLFRDIELACDEKVVKNFNNEQKSDYSQALLTCSVNRRMISACPIAFGEVDIKGRVKSVLNYKKPAFWIIVIGIIAVIVVAVCFLTDPSEPDDDTLAPVDTEDTTETTDKIDSDYTPNTDDVPVISDEQINNARIAYIDHLLQIEHKYDPMYFGTYAFYDLNRDGMPELLYYWEFHLYIYTYQNDKVRKIDSNSGFNGMNGSIKILANGAIMYEHVSTGTAYYYETLNKDNTMTKTNFYYYDFDGIKYDFFEYNGKEVNMGEWYELTKDIFAIPEATDIEWHTLPD